MMINEFEGCVRVAAVVELTLNVSNVMHFYAVVVRMKITAKQGSTLEVTYKRCIKFQHNLLYSDVNKCI